MYNMSVNCRVLAVKNLKFEVLSFKQNKQASNRRLNYFELAQIILQLAGRWFNDHFVYVGAVAHPVNIDNCRCDVFG